MSDQNNQLQRVENQLQEERNISDKVFNQVTVLQEKGSLSIPPNYDVGSAVKQAWLKIQETKDRQGKPALDVVTKPSIANALLDMVTQGLNAGKDQGYFIVYGDKLQFQTSAHGNVTMLKRDAGAEDVIARPIYEDDSFEYSLDGAGRIKDIEHKQKFGNINKDKIVGAYATIVFNDKPNHIEIMTLEQLEQAWMQSSMIKDRDALKRSKTHNNFKEEMARKTVINRAAKRYIKTSDDKGLIENARKVLDRQRKEVFDAEVDENQATEVIDIPADDTQWVDQSEATPERVDAETGEIQDDGSQPTKYKTADPDPF